MNAICKHGWPTWNPSSNSNGGDFVGAEMAEMKDMTMAAYLPWPNGIYEKGHQVIDAMLEVMEQDHPDYLLEVLLS